MEVIKWANGQGQTLKIDNYAELVIIKKALDTLATSATTIVVAKEDLEVEVEY